MSNPDYIESIAAIAAIDNRINRNKSSINTI